MTRDQARILYQHYDELIKKLMAAKLALLEGGVQSYSIGDRSLTKFDLGKLTDEIDDAIRKRSEYEAIMNGRGARKAVGVIPRDI